MHLPCKVLNMEIAKRLWDFQQNNILCDVEFKLRKSKKLIKAHRNVLACGSYVFRRMFTGSLQETKVHIPNIDPDAFTEVLRYLYIDECKMDFQNVDQILDCAEKYDLGKLRDTGYQFLACNLSFETIWQIFYMANVYFLCTKLPAQCLHFYESNSMKCLESNFIQNLPESNFCKIVKHNCVSCKEEYIYEACLRWAVKQMRNGVPKDNDIRKQLVRSNILYNVRFSCISKDYFEENISKRNILSKEEITSIRRSRDEENFSGGLFCSDIRRPKLHRLVRCKPRLGRNWVVGLKEAINICFREVVLLHGIIVFGSLSGESSYTIDVYITDYTCAAENRKLSVIKGKVLNTNDMESFYDVLLKEPVKLNSNKKYNIELCMQGSCTAAGFDYQADVSDGTFRVTFTNSSRSANGTCSKDGQIPGLIVSKIYDS